VGFKLILLSYRNAIVTSPKMDISFYSKKFGVTNKEVNTTAENHLRLSKVRNRGNWPGGETVRALGCFIIACKSHNHSFDKKFAVKMCGSEKGFQNTITSLQNLLGVADTLGVKNICMKFGSVSLEDKVNKLLLAFKSRYLKTLPTFQQQAANMDRDIYKVVAFYCVARKEKTKIDKSILRGLCCCSDKEFTTVQQQFLELCPDLLPPSKTAKAARIKRKRREDAADHSCDEDVLAGEAVTAEDLQTNPALAATKRGQYESWKIKVIESEEQERAQQKEQPPLKQSKLRF